MKLILHRHTLTPLVTLGELLVLEYGKPTYKFCDTLERANRDLNKNGKFDNGEQKIYGETAIPYGEYRVDFTYSPHFGRNMPILLDVPNFDGIRIHAASTVNDLKGCIGVGRAKGDCLTDTRATSDALNDLISRKIAAAEEVTINII